MTDIQTAQQKSLARLAVEYGWRVGSVLPCVYAAALHVFETNVALGKLDVSTSQAILALRQPYLDVYAPAVAAVLSATTVEAVNAVSWTWPAA